jgi:hypothetical protein
MRGPYGGRVRRATLPGLGALALGLLAGCPSDESCGPGNAAGDGLTMTASGVEIRYHALTAGANNDCPEAGAPAGVVSLTIGGFQVAGSDAVTLCVPRPDQLAGGLALGAGVQIVDVSAEQGGCTFSRNPQTPPTGTARAEGICEDGVDPAGFALVLDGTVAVDRVCGATNDTLMMTLAGTVSVAGP